MKRLWRNLLIGGFLLAFILLLGFFNAGKPRILVLHSGTQGSRWVEQVDRGMRQALEQNRRPVNVEWNYLGIAGPTAGRNSAAAVAEARRAIDRFKPDVLIAVDDEANESVARNYVGREQPDILYVSIDRPAADYGYSGAPNVSGIAETMPWEAVRDALIQMFPGRAPTVAVLGVDTVTDRAELADLSGFDWGPARVTEKALVSTAGAWREFVERVAGVDALLILGDQDLPDDDGVVRSAAEMIRWTQDNARPLPIGTQIEFVAGGGALSFSPPPDFYGESAVRLALDWLDDRSTPGPPPPVESSHFEVAIRQEALARRGVALPPIYHEAARGTATLFP